MAFPAINAQQELNNRKILEELQLKKQQLTSKSTGAPAAITAQQAAAPIGHLQLSGHPLPQQSQQQPPPHQHPLPPSSSSLSSLSSSSSQSQQSQQNDITFNNSSRAAWLKATSESACFLLHQDSGYGNSILPVLPRFDA